MGISQFYNYIIEETIDPRTKDWFLVHSPVPLVLITLCYCHIIFVFGPNYMRNRKPYSCDTFIKLYNVFQIISNAWIVYSAATAGWTTSFSWGCEPLNTSPTGEGYRMAVVVWWAYMMKLIDLSETVLFVLRKKYTQISFLHVYHHVTTALMAWMCVKWNPGGMLSSILLINSTVHVIMYSYYLTSTGGPTIRRLIRPIKPWITVVQMSQFCILLAHLSQSFLSSCDVPKIPYALAVVDIIINFLLFYHFFSNNYMPKKVA